MPLVSVILPFFDSERYIDLAISSVLNQTYSNLELILLDDGSTDDSLAIAQKYADLDSRVRLHSHTNQGLCRTLQKGVSLAQGKYIARMDADDLAHPQRIALQVKYLEQTPECVALGSAITVIDPEGDTLYLPTITLEHRNLVDELIQWEGSRICHPTVMMRTEAVKSVGGYTQDYHFEDVDLFLKLATVGKLANLPDRLLWYRWHIASISHTRNQARIEEIKQSIVDKAKNELGLIPSINSAKTYTRSTPDSDSSRTYTEEAQPNLEIESYCKWCLIAREAGFYSVSLKYLSRIFLAKPSAIKTYWALVHFLLGEKYGSFVWGWLIKMNQLLRTLREQVIRA